MVDLTNKRIKSSTLDNKNINADIKTKINKYWLCPKR